MYPKHSPVLKLRDAVEDVGWHTREAVVAVEEGVVWRGADAVRDLADRAGDSWLAHATHRVRWAIERRLAWPLADALRDSGELARTSIATGAVVAALAAGTAGAMLADGGNDAGPVVAVAGPVTAVEADAASSRTLAGIAPDFASSRGGSDAAPETAQKAPSDPPARAAWRFAEAFVLYEVGRAGKAAGAFQRLASPALARSLEESPPRLPADAKVPKAQVLNVVLGKRKGKSVEASVSLVRLEAVSELRLTLQRSPRGWRVAGVLG
jgi:hypothetical protein